jgi:hypothetical protein
MIPLSLDRKKKNALDGPEKTVATVIDARNKGWL